MAKMVKQVILTGSKTFTDNRYKFKQNVPVTMAREEDFERYASNALFATREITEESLKGSQLSSKVNPGDPFGSTVSDDAIKLPKRKPTLKSGE